MRSVTRKERIYVKKIPSIKIIDLAKTIAPEALIELIGIRPGELHERMIGAEMRHLHTNTLITIKSFLQLRRMPMLTG